MGVGYHTSETGTEYRIGRLQFTVCGSILMQQGLYSSWQCPAQSTAV